MKIWHVVTNNDWHMGTFSSKEKAQAFVERNGSYWEGNWYWGRGRIELMRIEEDDLDPDW